MLRCCSTVRAGWGDLSDTLRYCGTVRAGWSDLSDMLRCCSTVRAVWVTSLTCYVAVVLSGRGGVTSLTCFVAVLLSGRCEAEGGGVGRRQRPEQERLRRFTDRPDQGYAGRQLEALQEEDHHEG